MSGPTELYRRALALRPVNPVAAEDALRAAAKGFGAAGDAVGRGESLLQLAQLALAGARLDEAQRYASRSLDCLRSADGDAAGRAAVTAAEVALCLDDEDRATALLHEARDRSPGAPRARALELLGQLALDHGDVETAEAHWLDAWRELEALGDPLRQAELRRLFAELALLRGRPRETIAQLEAALVALDALADRDAGTLRASVHTDLADLQADRGRTHEALLAYDAAHDFYARSGMHRQAERLDRRRETLRWSTKAG
ncbi:MAG: hypothetical protein AAF447_12815 [Myxococcota bacterium]